MSAVTFVEPMPGLGGLVSFELSPVDGADGLLSLTSLERAGVRLFLVDAGVHLADYTPSLSAQDRARVGAERPEELQLLVVANPAGDGGLTVNLMAPVLLHRTAARASQLILGQERWPLRHPLGEPLPYAV